MAPTLLEVRPILNKGLLPALALGCATPATAPGAPDKPGEPARADEAGRETRPERAGAADRRRSRPIVTAHNEARAEVGVPPLQWSASLARTAQQWADKLARRGCKLDHSNNRYGENLYAASGAVSPEHVVETWVAERQNYNHARNTCRGVCGHYTQVVWAKSKQVGCGSAQCDNMIVWVCNYDPAGNFVGEKPY